MQEKIKSLLAKIGYRSKCKSCNHVQFHFGRFVSDIMLTAMFLIVGFTYLTQEKPYIDAVNNCTAVWNELNSKAFIPNIKFFNNSTPVPADDNSFPFSSVVVPSTVRAP